MALPRSQKFRENVEAFLTVRRYVAFMEFFLRQVAFMGITLLLFRWILMDMLTMELQTSLKVLNLPAGDGNFTTGGLFEIDTTDFWPFTDGLC